MAKQGDETIKERVYTGTKQISADKMLVKLKVGTDSVMTIQPIGEIDDAALDRKLKILKANAIKPIEGKKVPDDKASIVAAEIAKATAKAAGGK